MNRRQFVKRAPAAPVALALQALVTPQATEAATLDTRPSFRLADYVLWHPGVAVVCPVHSVDHGAYTHGCVPIAFPPDYVPAANRRPATADALPWDVYDGCPFSRPGSGFAHQHHDFRWEDA